MKWCKGAAAPVRPLICEDKFHGGFTADPGRILEMVWHKWSDIMCRGCPEVGVVFQEYTEEIREARSDFTFPQADVESYHEVLMERSDEKQGGLDFWKTGELKRLPQDCRTPW